MAGWQDAEVLKPATAAPVAAASGAPAAWQSAPQVQAGAPAAPAAYQPSSLPWLDATNAFANSAVNALPIIGPGLTSAGHNVDAAFNNLLAPVFGFQHETPDDRAKLDTAEQQQFPIASAAGSVAGTVAPMVIAGGIPQAATALGMTGNLATRVGAGVISGFGIGGADAIARGQKPEDAVHTAMLDAAMGGATPLAFKGMGAAWRSVTGQPTFASSAQTLARGLSDDKIDPHLVNVMLAKLGPGAVVADLGPNLRDQAGALAALPGKAKSTIVDALTARNASRNQRIAAEINDTLGPSPVPSRVDAGIQGDMDRFRDAYGALFANSSRVDTTPLAQNLEADIVNRRGEAQGALQKVRNMLNIHGAPDHLDPNPYTLFQTRQAIDGMLEGEENTKVIQALTDARHQVDSILAPAVPGLKEVDAQFEELARQRSGLMQGTRVLGSGPMAAPPGELEDIIAAGVQPKGIGVGPSAETFRLAQGTRAEIERIVGTTTNDLTALKGALKGDGSWNRDRLAQIYGSDKADRLITLLNNESTKDETYSTALRNSLTASREAGKREMSSDVTGLPTNATLTGIVGHALTKGANAGLAFNKAGVNAEIASGLMGNSMSSTDATILAAIMKQRAKPSMLAPATVPLLYNHAMGQ